MKHKTSELEGALLDAAVAKADEEKWYRGCVPFEPSTSWADGGRIIERERIVTGPDADGGWFAGSNGSITDSGSDTTVLYGRYGYGPTPLIAAMRAFVASRFGEEVELP